jgi:hypothetical protein
MEIDKQCETKKGTPSPPYIETKPDTPMQNHSSPSGNTPGQNYPPINNQHQIQGPPQGQQQIPCHQPIVQGNNNFNNFHLLKLKSA